MIARSVCRTQPGVIASEEVFVVLDGAVDMHFRDADGEHVQHPVGEARVLVVEQAGSV